MFYSSSRWSTPALRRAGIADLVKYRSGAGGGGGFVRLERAGAPPTVADLGRTIPPAGPTNVGPLREIDRRSGFQSVFRVLGGTMPPVFVRYAVVNGTAMTFSDDPSIGPLASVGSAPVLFFGQGRDAHGGSNGPWQSSLRRLNGFTSIRWLLVLDRSYGATVTITAVRLVYRA